MERFFFILQIMYEISVNDMRLEALDFFYNLLSYTAKRCALHFTAIKRNGKNLLVKSLRVIYYSVKVYAVNPSLFTVHEQDNLT